MRIRDFILGSLFLLITLLVVPQLTFALGEGSASSSDDVLLEAPIQKKEVVIGDITPSTFTDDVIHWSGFVTQISGGQISIISPRDSELKTLSFSGDTSITSLDNPIVKNKTLQKISDTVFPSKRTEPVVSIGDFVSINGMKSPNGEIILKKIIIMHDGSKVPSQFIK